MNPIDPNAEALARRTSIHELCAAWATSAEEIRQAFGLLVTARDRLKTTFDGTGYDSRFDIAERNGRRPDYDQPAATLKDIERQAWAAIVGRLELRKVMSLQRSRELDKQLETGDGLPDLNTANVLAMLETTLNNAGQFLEEKVFECYENLRPRGWTLNEYKTNQKSAAAGVGQKVIMGYTVRRNYSGRGFEVQYGRAQDELRALDQVFHLLDGKPTQSASWAGELCDAIREQTKAGGNQFATPYFRGRCFGNGNLHLEFIREDLVAQFNLIAGGARLQDVKN